MNAPIPGFAAAERNFERQEPREFVAQDWPASTREYVSDVQVEEFIAHVADCGYYKDQFGNPVKADELFSCLCIDWLHNRTKIPGMTYHAFWKLAKAKCQLEAFGQ